MSKKTKKKIPSFFTEEEVELFIGLSKEQRGHIQHMGENRARNYLFRCVNESTIKTGKDIKREINDIADSIFDDKLLSKKINESDLQGKNFRCKYCGHGFRTDESRDKHQKICM